METLLLPGAQAQDTSVGSWQAQLPIVPWDLATSLELCLGNEP